MVGSKAEKDHRRRVGKNWVMIGFWKNKNMNTHVEQPSREHEKPRLKPPTLTLRYSTGLVTLNLSMVEMMMAGVVRKKRRMKRTMLMMRQRIHQENPPTDRCSLWETGCVAVRLTPREGPAVMDTAGPVN